MELEPVMTFQWRPGIGPDENALARMRAHLPRPREPMGEAWFMGAERKLHRDLAAVGVPTLPLPAVHSALWDIASGTHSFGHLEEWDEWLRYMLADLIARSHEQYAFDFLLENTVTAFMAVHWTGIPEEYPGFARDTLACLGHALMKPEFWAPDPLDPANPLRRIPRFLCIEERGEESLYGWGSSNAPGSLSAGMAFCLKYLPPTDLQSWAGALFDIEHPQWRFALLVWYVGAQDFRMKSIPAPRDLEKAAPRITWENSHVLCSGPGEPTEPPDSGWNRGRDFLDATRIRGVLDAMRGQITVDRLAAWEESFWMDPLLAAEPALPAIINRALTTVAA